MELRGGGQVGGEAGGEVVDDLYIVVGGDELVGDNRAYVSGAAGDEQLVRSRRLLPVRPSPSNPGPFNGLWNREPYGLTLGRPDR